MNHITEFIIDGNDYFTAHLDNGGVRIGLINCASVDFPANHVRYDEIVALVDEDSIENTFDLLVVEYKLV